MPIAMGAAGAIGGNASQSCILGYATLSVRPASTACKSVRYIRELYPRLQKLRKAVSQG